jgi:hypothetical protein
VPQYITNVQATGDAAAAEAAFIALTVPSGLTIEIVRVRVSVQTISTTDSIRVRFLRCSTLGTGSTSGTAIKKDPLVPTSQVTVNKKNGATDWIPGTVGDVLEDVQFNGRSMIEWEAIDNDDKYIMNGSDAANIFIVSTNPSTTASVLQCVTVEWKEM